MLKRHDYDVVLIDMKLPKGDGRGVFQLVRETTPQARTVLITGHRGENEEIVSALLKEGANGVCYKPFDVAKLLATIGELAGGSKATVPKP
jgi:DNA-binding response OmpR family regulator